MLNKHFSKIFWNFKVTIRSIWNFCNLYLTNFLEFTVRKYSELGNQNALSQKKNYINLKQCLNCFLTFARGAVNTIISLAVSVFLVFSFFILWKLITEAFVISSADALLKVKTYILLNRVEFCIYLVLFNLYWISLFYYIRPAFTLIFNLVLGSLLNKIFIIMINYYFSMELLYSSKYFSISIPLSKEQIYFHIFRTFDLMNLSKEFHTDTGLFLLTHSQEFANFYTYGSFEGNAIIKEIISTKVEFLSEILQNSNLAAINSDETVSWLYYVLLTARVLASGFFIIIPLLSKNVTTYPYPFNSIEVNDIIHRMATAAYPIPPIPIDVHTPPFLQKVNVYQENDSIMLPFTLQLPRNIGSLNMYTSMWEYFGTQKLSTLLSHYSWVQPQDLRAIVGNVRLAPSDRIILEAYLNYIENLAVLPNNFQNYSEILQHGLHVIQQRIISRSFPINPILYPQSKNFQVYNDVFVEYKPIKKLFGNDVDLSDLHKYDYFCFL